MRKQILFLMLFFIARNVVSQSFSVRGTISDGRTGEDLIGATVVVEGTATGTASNGYGFYSLRLPHGKYTIRFSYTGYKTIKKKINLDKNLTLNIRLFPDNTMLGEVVITSERDDQNVRSAKMGIEKMDVKQMEKIPVLFGEKDILKTIQLLPGISTTAEGSSGFSVRGGAPDENLILLDEAPVYSASHLMGFFSVFNSDALKNVTVYKGGIPANFGGRTSSVVDVTMKEGNNQNFAVSGGLGLISSRLTVEGPVIKNKWSFIVSGRRSYADIAAKLVNAVENNISLYFYDLNAKMNYRINDNNRFFLSGYFGKDVFGFGSRMGMNWGNATLTARWNHIFNVRLFSNTVFIYSNYGYAFKVGDDVDMNSGIEDVNFKQDYTWFANSGNTLKFGFNIIRHRFNPGVLTFANKDSKEIILDKKQAFESALYVSNSQKLGGVITAEYGFRFSMFNQMGEGWANTYNDKNEKTDSVYFGKGEVMKTYMAPEPRLSLSYMINETSSVKISYNRMAQYLHLLSNSTSGQPTDTWMPSSTNLKPLFVSQYSLGYFRNFKKNQFEFSIEGYWKQMTNVPDYKDGTDILLNENIEAYILSGSGRSYGLEFYIKKRYGKLTGWLSYTFSKTEKKIPGINNDEWYPARYDKTHDVSLVGSYQISKRVSFSLTWIYYTGNAVTFPSGRYVYDGNIIPYYTGRNGYRMPDYHRLDFNLHLEGKRRKKFRSGWDFSVYNVYNRHNAYTITFRESETSPGTTEAVRLTLFGIVPSITWNFKF